MTSNRTTAAEMTAPATPTATNPAVGTPGLQGTVTGLCIPYWLESVIEATRLELPGLQALAGDVQQRMMTERLDTLQQRGLLSADVATMFKGRVNGSLDFGTDPNIGLFDAAGSLTLAGVLNKALTPAEGTEFVNPGDAAVIALAAAAGAGIGSIAGPVGAAFGAAFGAYVAAVSI